MNKSIYRNDEGVLLTYPQIASRYNLGMNMTIKLAKESGALIRIGRCSRVDPEIFEKYLRETYSVKE